MRENKLSRSQFMTISLTLFAMYFGAGNFIFPPNLGKEAGDHFYIAILFFCATAVLIPVLGVAGIARAKGLRNLVDRVDPIFAIVFIVLLYLTIGPLFAIPRAANMPFDIAIKPFINLDNLQIYLMVYSALYFALNYYLCMNPSRLVKLLGRYLTPILLVLILLLFGAGFLFPIGEFVAATGDYAAHPAAKGFVEGYQTMDTLASLAFGIIVINAIRAVGIKDEDHLVGSTIKAGIMAGIILMLIYLMLGYLGATSASLFKDTAINGAELLSRISDHYFGGAGVIILGSAFFLACLTTTLGLITSAGEYFVELTNGRVRYKVWVILWCVIGFGVANFGLTTIIKGSIPVLVAIYPVAIILVILSLINHLIDSNKIIYRACVYTCVIIGIVNGLDIIGVNIPLLTNFIKTFPFYDSMLGWIVPSIVAFALSYVYYFVLDKKEGSY
ncbi:branched-chain amino acid transport system II carrier protein [Campylobacter sp. faydin G-24]|uniref:Branched-chain amino acid transport system II carrier protein n=1 Tax=Campylobacter anatolicus TaxID=2829105 RepID=A0ABS5HHC0_9BACT|nr:branched-chain amino acid transport system II carrier protein [Campylobacter anatolicus]MBR8463673.1 branched-chain amino acid transport system II carrier protein [Campylobacter anatolicus]MBR8466414.1 branched-chain amino acid transport system II carrier protein [Campylobacter anatolicus]